MHLYYKEGSDIVINKLSKVWNGDVYISLIDGGENNKYIIELCKAKFKNVYYHCYPNMGNDQYGFMKIYKKYIKNDIKWILYLHDKKDILWLNDLLDIIDLEKIHNINNYLREENGIISTSKRKEHIPSKQALLRISNYRELIKCSQNKKKLYDNTKIIQTLTYLEFLIDLYNKEARIDKYDYAHKYFTAGNIFYINKKLLDIIFEIVIDDFFDGYYVIDGTIAHAMERFYYYLAHDLKYKVIYI